VRISAAQLESEINEAFSGAHYPGDDNVAYDQTSGHLEGSAVAAKFRGKSWQALNTGFLRRNADSIFFFSPAGYVYFLPAFMLATIHDFKRADMIPLNTVVSLSPSLSQAQSETFSARIRGLTLEQRKVVARFLAYLDRLYADYFPGGEPRIALEESWSQYFCD
jgi:hypothetical protein